jgi:hypothetical protein
MDINVCRSIFFAKTFRVDVSLQTTHYIQCFLNDLYLY